MTTSRGPSSDDRRWMALADELTPARSLARLETATARVVTTVSVVATLLTGFGLVAAGRPTTRPVLVLAVCSVVLAVSALLAAMAAQVLVIYRHLNLDNLAEVQNWYQRRFQIRAPLTRAATVLIVAAATTAGAAAVTALLSPDPGDPVISVTRTAELAPGVATADAPSTVIVDARFPGLDAGDVLSLTVTVDGVPVAEAATGPADDGVASRSLTISHVPARSNLALTASGGGYTCSGSLRPHMRSIFTC